ncbi:MAG: hypothetical protein FWC82_00275 [Firmicutes bacterium]|nr:hypothetical protein [Bacillota bacterium]
MKKRKLGIVAIVAIVLAAAFAFMACGIAPTTSHSGRVQDGTRVVLDFNVAVATRAEYQIVRDAWNDAAGDDALAINEARARLDFRPAPIEGITSVAHGALVRPTQARAFLSNGVNMFGEIDWAETSATVVGNELAANQGFFRTNTAAHDSSDNLNTTGVIAGWLGVEGEFTTHGALQTAVNARWAYADAESDSARVARRTTMLTAIAANFISAEMRELGYNAVVFTDTQLETQGTPFPITFTQVLDADNAVVEYSAGHGTFTVTRHLRFTLNGASRVYFARVTVRGHTIETITYSTWNAAGDSYANDGTSTVFIIYGEEDHTLRPMFRRVGRENMNAGDTLVITFSDYIDGQLRTIGFYIMVGGTMVGDEISFIINRPS